MNWNHTASGVRFGPENTSTFYKNYKEDIKLLKEVGHNSFRTSYQLGKIVPRRKRKS